MIRVRRTMVVPRPLASAVDHLADFGNARDWDPATVSCVRLDEPPPGAPIEPGARWRNTSRFRGRTSDVDYRLAVREPDRLLFTGENRTVAVRDDMRFRALPDGTTELTYEAVFRFKGVARLVAPFLRKDVERLADGVAERLPRATAP
ncbi:SRPBCC family protein [Streptomyces sp. NPDC097619]|uniref:SRPBCC family protein n=1 Tax=Streptomyces sp. NPDC097619 TaxID=3157228 RepID=UPI00331779BB